eukprot:scaffold29115_cov56-Attheya_sp.AAC.3
MDKVTIQVKDVDIKDVLIKEEDVVRLTNVQVHGCCPIKVANEAKSDPCHYHGNAHTWLKCYGNPDGPNNRPGFTPRPHGATGRGRGVEVIGMTPTRMMPLIMQAPIIIMRRVQHQRLQTISMPLDGALVISLLIMQLPTIIGLIPLVHLNDTRAARSSLSRQTEDLILPIWRTVIY